MLSLDEIIKEITDKSDKSEDEIKKMIEEKQDELSGLVSPEGAAYIVAKELGVNLLKETDRDLRIKNIVSGMRSVDIDAKILKVYDTRTFNKNGREGRVKNIILADESGSIRFSLWDTGIDDFEKLEFKENNSLKVTGGFVIEDNRGSLELRLGKKGSISKSEKEIVTNEVPQEMNFSSSNKSIIEFGEGDFITTRASLVQVFPKKPFFEVCPQCDGRLEKSESSWKCKEHGDINDPKYQMVVSGFADDGSGNIRVVFFREMAEKVLGKSADEVVKTFVEKGDLTEFFENLDILGNEYIMTGRVKRNNFTENLEMVVNEVDIIDVNKECEQVITAIRTL